MLPPSNVPSPPALSPRSVAVYLHGLCWRAHWHSRVFPVKTRGPRSAAPTPEHVLLSPRAAIPGTNSESAVTMLTAPTEKTHRMGPDGPINALKRKRRRQHKIHFRLGGITSRDESHI